MVVVEAFLKFWHFMEIETSPIMYTPQHGTPLTRDIQAYSN